MTSAKKSGKFKKYIFWLIILLVLAILLGANLQVSQTIKELSEEAMPSISPPPVNPSQASDSQKPELNGIYKGNLPCADCEGITETLILAEDGSYIIEDIYRGKSVKPIRTQGKWSLVNKNVLKLAPADGTQPEYFQIPDSTTLQMLDSNMQKIDSPFDQTLKKQ
ncbi:MAG TPA: copper resistance protein NlpE [Patescibacteria group bacterium]|nr:copper resistance protein NlpE [Patescibacteria group bacterium]